MRIDHVAMYVRDLERAKDFFMRYFGAKPNELYHNQKTGFRSYFLTFDQGARLEIMNKPEAKDSGAELARTGFIHGAFSVGSKEKVDELSRSMTYLELSNEPGYMDEFVAACFLPHTDGGLFPSVDF